MSYEPNSRLALRSLAIIGRGINPYLALAAGFLALHIFFDPTVPGFIASNIRQFLFLGIVMTVVFGFFLWYMGHLTHNVTIALIVLIGVLIRVMYILYTSPYVRQHDVGRPDGYGHMGYIFHFIEKWALPEHNKVQFYHPPLHHAISALWYRINAIFNMGEERIIQSLQYLTAFYSSCFTIVAYRIFKRLDIKGSFLVAATALISLHPTMFILAGSVNNDMLSILFYASALLWLLKWWEAQNIKNTVFLALCVGLGMMTKLSNVTLAFIIAPFFAIKLFKAGELAQKAALCVKYGLFGLISVPLGLWHSIRNYIVLNQPIGYVMQLPVGGDQWTGDYTLIERIFSFSTEQLFYKLWTDTFSDWNLPVFILKSSVFGEYRYNADINAVAIALLFINFVVIIISILAMIYLIAKLREQKKHSPMIWMLFLAWIVQIIFFVYFYIRYPFGCTMDFRYIVPTLICGIGFISIAAQRVSLENPEFWKKLRAWVYTLVIMFIIFSSAFYLLI